MAKLEKQRPDLFGEAASAEADEQFMQRAQSALTGGWVFQTPFFSPTASRTRQNGGGTQRPKRLNLPLYAGRSLLGVDGPAETRLS